MSYDQVKDQLVHLNTNQVTEAVWLVIRGNLHTLGDIETWQKILFGEPEPVVFSSEDQDFLKQAVSCLPEDHWNQDTWGQWTQCLKEMTNRKGKMLFMPLRQALTGLDHGPEMKELLPLIGYQQAKARLEKTKLT
jgi:glutamyl-tRNA synthetase